MFWTHSLVNWSTIQIQQKASEDYRRAIGDDDFSKNKETFFNSIFIEAMCICTYVWVCICICGCTLYVYFYLVKLSCMPDISAFLNHSHRAATITRCALKVCTCIDDLCDAISCISISDLFIPLRPGAWLSCCCGAYMWTSNSISDSWAECRSRKAFFDKLLLAAIGGSQRWRMRLSCRGERNKKSCGTSSNEQSAVSYVNFSNKVLCEIFKKLHECHLFQMDHYLKFAYWHEA